MAMPLVKIPLLVFICRNKIQSDTEKIKYPQYISLRQVFKGYPQRILRSEQGLRLCFKKVDGHNSFGLSVCYSITLLAKNQIGVNF